MAGRVTIMRLLLEATAGVNARREVPVTTLSLAVASERKAVVRLLLEAGAGPRHIFGKFGHCEASFPIS